MTAERRDHGPSEETSDDVGTRPPNFRPRHRFEEAE